jgi:hypothetical protein
VALGCKPKLTSEQRREAIRRRDEGKRYKMIEIRAFVGHSFTNDDSEVVSKFLKYFEQVSKSHPNFSWNHAEPAEPRLLAEKVMSIISEANVFIGRLFADLCG